MCDHITEDIIKMKKRRSLTVMATI